jgi:hypothetical protein
MMTVYMWHILNSQTKNRHFHKVHGLQLLKSQFNLMRFKYFLAQDLTNQILGILWWKSENRKLASFWSFTLLTAEVAIWLPLNHKSAQTFPLERKKRNETAVLLWHSYEHMFPVIKSLFTITANSFKLICHSNMHNDRLMYPTVGTTLRAIRKG